MSPTPSAPLLPQEFAAALESITHAQCRPELTMREIPAPEQLAPFAHALSADVGSSPHAEQSELGTGRLVVLYDPAQPDAWGGPWRIVCFAQAPLETEIGLDPFLADVTWSWLIDALSAKGARYTAASGTATKIISTGFGELAQQSDGAQIELRASWSPLDGSLASHVEGWCELLCMLAGLPPTPDVVSLLSHRRAQRG